MSNEPMTTEQYIDLRERTTSSWSTPLLEPESERPHVQ